MHIKYIHPYYLGPPAIIPFSKPERQPHSPLSDHSATINMADRRTVADHISVEPTTVRSSITLPAVESNNWTIPPTHINTIAHSVQFHGLRDEDPHSHLIKFSRVCNTFQINGVTTEAISLRLFPFSLSGQAAIWLDSLPNGAITSWPDLQTKSCKSTFPPLRLLVLEILSMVLLSSRGSPSMRHMTDSRDF